MTPEVIFKFPLKRATSLRAINYRLVFQLMRKCVFGGMDGKGGGGGGGVKPPSLNICSGRFILALLIFQIQFVSGNSISFSNKKVRNCWGKWGINPAQRQSTASRPITYRSLNLKRWNIPEGKVSSLLKSSVLCKKMLTLEEKQISYNLKTTQNFGFWKTCLNNSSVILSFNVFIFESFHSCTFHFYFTFFHFEMIELRCQKKNCRIMYFRIIIFVSFLKIPCASDSVDDL